MAETITKTGNSAQKKLNRGSHLDTTQVKEGKTPLKNALQNTLQKAKRAIEEKKRMTEILSTDLRAPLTNMSMILDLVESPEEEAPFTQLKSSLNLMLNISRQTLESLNNVIDWAAKETNSLHCIPQNVLFEQLINRRQYSNMAKYKKIDLRIEVQPGFTLFVDPHMISHSFSNLLSNAVKFTPKGGKVSIKAKYLPTGEKEVRFSDTGVGMSAQQIEMMLLTKRHPTSSGTTNERSNKLGFALSRDFIKCNRGKLSIESKLSKGSTVRIVFPPTAS